MSKQKTPYKMAATSKSSPALRKFRQDISTTTPSPSSRCCARCAHVGRARIRCHTSPTSTTAFAACQHSNCGPILTRSATSSTASTCTPTAAARPTPSTSPSTGPGHWFTWPTTHARCASTQRPPTPSGTPTRRRRRLLGAAAVHRHDTDPTTLLSGRPTRRRPDPSRGSVGLRTCGVRLDDTARRCRAAYRPGHHRRSRRLRTAMSRIGGIAAYRAYRPSDRNTPAREVRRGGPVEQHVPPHCSAISPHRMTGSTSTAATSAITTRATIVATTATASNETPITATVQ